MANPIKSGVESAHQAKVHKVMHEFKQGSLRTSAGKKVRNRKQAIAIAMSEARRYAGK